jgi:hypothetical protein
MVTCFPPLQPARRLRARCAADAQRMRSGCAADAQRMRSGCAADAQRMRSGCAADAQRMRGLNRSTRCAWRGLEEACASFPDFCDYHHSFMFYLELHAESVFFGRYFSVFLDIFTIHRYRRKTRSVFLVSKLWLEPLKKLAGAPFFPRRGASAPFLYFALLLKKKRNSRGIFQKKSSRKILKRCSRQSLEYNNADRKIPIPAVSDTG